MVTYLGENASAAVFIGLGKISRVPSLVSDWSTVGGMCLVGADAYGETVVVKSYVE